jgi:hypothetical protein
VRPVLLLQLGGARLVLGAHSRETPREVEEVLGTQEEARARPRPPRQR